MALESGITLYDQIKGKITGTPTKDAGFFDFGTFSLGDADPSLFTEPTQPIMDQPFTPEGMVPEQIYGGVIGELDYSKGVSPVGFYEQVSTDVGDGQYEDRTQKYTDQQAAELLGLPSPQTAQDFANLDARMADRGAIGAYAYSRTRPPAGSVGFTKTTEAGRQAQSLVSTIAGPLGIVADAAMGDVYVGLGGRKELDPFGLPGLVTERVRSNLYNIAKQEERGLPGYNVYVSTDGQLRGVKPSSGLAKLFGQEYSVVGTDADLNKVKTELAMTSGLDPQTYDISTGKGTPLQGMVTGFGGFAEDGSFVNMVGERSGGMNHGYTGLQYGSALADIYGQDYAVSLMREQSSNVLSSGGFLSAGRAQYYSTIADTIASGAREQYSFGTGKAITTGGYVRSLTGQPVRTSTGFAYSGRRYSPQERSANLANMASNMGFDMDRGNQDTTGSYSRDLGFDEGDT